MCYLPAKFVSRLVSGRAVAHLTLPRYSAAVKFTVVNHRDVESGFWAEVPALPGCMSQGETLAELKRNLREAIAGYLEVMREEGREPEVGVQLAEVAV